MKDTLSGLIDKYVDYGTENWLKALLTLQRPDRTLENINPYIGVLQYPSSAFLQHDLSYKKSTQAIGTVYVGHLDMLLPDFVSPVNTSFSYSLLSFMLDGVQRKFIQVSNGEEKSQNIKFQDFVLSLHPGANDLIPMNRNAFHILSDIEVTGATYLPSTGLLPFEVNTSGQGAFTEAIQFEISISGYRCLMI